MNPRRWLTPILTLGVGLILGYQMHPTSESVPTPTPETVVEVREVKVEVEKEVQVEVPARLSAACKESIRFSDEMWSLVKQYEKNIGDHKTSLADAHSAVVLKDIEGLLEADASLRSLQGRTLGDLIAIRNAIQKYRASHERCLKEIE